MEVWLYEQTDNEKFASKLDAVDWNALLSDSEDVDEMCNTFTCLIPLSHKGVHSNQNGHCT
jgi:hypothetical protein